MVQAVSVITLGVSDLARSRRFYAEGFAWAPVFESDEIVFYQLNGTVLGTWLADKLAEDSRRAVSTAPGAFALAQNLSSRDDVDRLMAALVRAGGAMLRPADEPPHGGYRGYVADPDGHAWELAWNPGFVLHVDGSVTFGE